MAETLPVRWTTLALRDLVRLHDFLAAVHQAAAARAVQAMTEAVDRLPEYPRQGRRLREFDPREVRRIIVRGYEVRYEIHDLTIVILRLWHTREER